jgi:hypothetical protein
MRVKKRVKRGVKKGIKSVKSVPPEAYLAGVGMLVGGAAVVLLATTKSGRELLSRTAQLALRPEADEQESQESDAQEDVPNEPAEGADVEEESDTNGDGESEVIDLKPRNQRPRSQGKAATTANKGTYEEQEGEEAEEPTDEFEEEEDEVAEEPTDEYEEQEDEVAEEPTDEYEEQDDEEAEEPTDEYEEQDDEEAEEPTDESDQEEASRDEQPEEPVARSPRRRRSASPAGRRRG